jgi:hypothetical protein
MSLSQVFTTLWIMNLWAQEFSGIDVIEFSAYRLLLLNTTAEPWTKRRCKKSLGFACGISRGDRWNLDWRYFNVGRATKVL